MTVEEEDLLESMVGYALGHIEAKRDENLGFDMDRTGEVDVVEIKSVRNGRKDQDPTRCAPAHLMTNSFREKTIDIEGQVATVLFGRPSGQNHYRLPTDGLIKFRPGQAAVQVFGCV
jgi:hypothetical protein